LRLVPHQGIHLVHRNNAIIGSRPYDVIHIRIVVYGDIPRRIEIYETQHAVPHEIQRRVVVEAFVEVLVREEDVELSRKWIQRSKVSEIFPVDYERRFSPTVPLISSRGISCSLLLLLLLLDDGVVYHIR
jgi:hypothetical protein